jgi:hypothetical protein
MGLQKIKANAEALVDTRGTRAGFSKPNEDRRPAA